MRTNVLIVGAVTLVLGFALLARDPGRVSSDEAQALVKAGALLVDVRTSEEFADGHLPGAVNLPVDALDVGAKALGDKSRPLVVYCFSGSRSARAARQLRADGFTHVDDLGGLSRWTGPRR